MEKKTTKKQVNVKSFKDNCMKPQHHQCHSGNAVYGLGFIGAAIYFISTATGFWNGVLGFLKAIVWPAFLVFYVMKHLGM
jgi:predicted NodU family carbamoyl transferase